MRAQKFIQHLEYVKVSKQNYLNQYHMKSTHPNYFKDQKVFLVCGMGSYLTHKLIFMC